MASRIMIMDAVVKAVASINRFPTKITIVGGIPPTAGHSGMTCKRNFNAGKLRNLQNLLESEDSLPNKYDILFYGSRYGL